ncbi:hypothetical protein [Chitinimonas taiwanensis]
MAKQTQPATPPATPAPQQALPTQGGSYVRQPDGSLTKAAPVDAKE